MFTTSSASGAAFPMRGWMADEGFPNFAAWTARAGYLLSMGRPTAQIAVYHPAMSMWLGETGASQATLPSTSVTTETGLALRGTLAAAM